MSNQCVYAFIGATLVAVSSAMGGGGVLLIPDSGADKIWAFDPFDGSLINENFVPNHSSLAQPINAIDSGRGTILVSDETNDSILEFGADGSFIGTFASAAAGIDGPFGLTRRNGQVYVASTINSRIVRIDDDGSNAITWASVNNTPRDIVFRDNDALVSESGFDDILRYDLSGGSLGVFHNSDGASGIDFPQQLQLEPSGNVLAAGFTAPLGIYTYDSSGAQIAAFTNLITSPRGVFRLGNGDILYAGGTRVMKYDPDSLTETTVVNRTGASFRFIEFSEIPAPSGAGLIVAAALLAGRRRR